MLERAEAIDEQARRWLARNDRGSLSGTERIAFDAWLDADTRHRGAYLRAEAIWLMLDDGADGRVDDGEAGSAHSDREHRYAPTRRWVLAGAGGLAAAAVGGLGFMTISALGRGRIDTGVGDIRRVALEDGSLAVVNTSSLVDVALRSTERLVTIESGEAWFAVAKDKARPFLVEAGDVRVRAIGTAFSVRRRGDGADVQVTEGTVAIWTTADERNAVRLSAGSRAFVDALVGPAIPQQAPLAIDRSLAWRSGEIALDGETLGEAAAEFNRYNRRKILIDDADIASARLVGRFRTNEPDAFVAAAIKTLRSQWTDAGEAIRLTETRA